MSRGAIRITVTLVTYKLQAIQLIHAISLAGWVHQPESPYSFPGKPVVSLGVTGGCHNRDSFLTLQSY